MTEPSGTPSLPQWWSDPIDAAWKRSRDAAISDWSVRGDRAPIESSIVEHALAFGHGARSAYSTCVTWDAIEPQLSGDWIRLGNMGTASWDRIAHIVRHEWQRAAGPGGDAAPEPAAASPQDHQPARSS